MTLPIYAALPIDLIDVELALKESEAAGRNFLNKEGYTDWEIDMMVEPSPLEDDFSAWVPDDPKRDENLTEVHYAIFLLRHCSDIRKKLACEDLATTDWISHGFMLAWLRFASSAETRFARIFNKRQSTIACKPRKRFSLPRMVLKHLVPDVRTAGQFKNYVGGGISILKLRIEVAPITDHNNKLIKYEFKDLRTGKTQRLSPTSIPKTILELRS